MRRQKFLQQSGEFVFFGFCCYWLVGRCLSSLVSLLSPPVSLSLSSLPLSLSLSLSPAHSKAPPCIIFHMRWRSNLVLHKWLVTSHVDNICLTNVHLKSDPNNIFISLLFSPLEKEKTTNADNSELSFIVLISFCLFSLSLQKISRLTLHWMSRTCSSK